MEEEYIAGKHAVLEALRAGRAVNKIWIAAGAQKTLVHPIVSEAKSRGIVVQQTDKRRLDQMAAGVQHQGVVAQAAVRGYAELDDILDRARSAGEPPLIVVLDEVEDPHNLGSILRSADCAGVHGIVVPKRRSAGLTAAVAKTSAGAMEYVPVARVTNVAQTLDKLKADGIWICGADGSAEQDVYETDLTLPLAVVIGNEGRGLGRLIKEKCDFLAKLPMRGQINSLNASVAASLFMYEALRQRRAGSPDGARGGSRWTKS